MATEGAIVIASHLVKDMTYDPLTDLKAVSLVIRTAPLISVHPSHEAQNMKQLLELARANPGKYNYGHSGVGGPNHLAFEMMKQMAEVDITDIAYRGTGAVIPAALSNEVGILIAYLPSSMPHIRSGALRPLAVTSDERSARLPAGPTVAPSGGGSPNPLAFEMMKQRAEVDSTDFANRGTAAVSPAALSNEVGILIAYLPSSMPHIRSGALRPVAVTSDERSESLPDVPTVAESGVEGYELSSWIGLFAPKDTPDEVIETLNAAIKDALQLDGVRKTIESGGQTIVGNTAAEFQGVVQADYNKYAKLIADLGIEAE